MKPRFIPCLGYNDAKLAIQWLCDAFGFEEKETHESENGIVVHAELTYQGNMIMVASSNRDSPHDKLTKHPKEVNGFVTQCPYILIDEDEIDAHYQRAKNHDAKIVFELAEQDYGGKVYTCYDPEGHLWSFGSFDPWK